MEFDRVGAIAVARVKNFVREEALDEPEELAADE